jgi:hypothetical protein
MVTSGGDQFALITAGMRTVPLAVIALPSMPRPALPSGPRRTRGPECSP